MTNGHPGNGNGNGNGRWLIRRLRRWGRQSNHRRRRRVWGYRAGGSGSTRLVAFAASAGLLLMFAVLIAASTAYAAYNYVAFHLPTASLDGHRQSQTVRIFDRHGRLLYEFWDEKLGRRTVGELEDFSPYLIAATLAVEDPTYYENAGVDLRSVIRAVIQNTAEGEIVSGASTITMQLVRNVIFSVADRNEQSLTRKTREALLAYQLTQRYTKDELLEMYLNEVYYGHLAYGVEAAARTYFNKSAAELTLAEAALIAGLPQAPALYDPLQNPKAARERQLYVINALARNGFITEARAEQAKQEPLNYQPPKNELLAPHFTLFVKDHVERTFGVQPMFERGFNIYTTLDYELLTLAEEESRKHLAELEKNKKNASDAAVVTIDPRTGEVLVMMGSPDYHNAAIAGEVNLAIAPRQPGSTLKPFTYLTAFEQGKLTPATLMPDQPTQFPGGRGQPAYAPLNHDKRWHGLVTVRRALSSSLNLPAVLALHWVGLENMLNTIHRLGIRSLPYDPDRIGLAVTLGGGEVNLLELTFAYTPFANSGRLVGQPIPEKDRQPGYADLEPAVIKKIVDSAGKTVFEYEAPPGPEVIRPEHAYQIASILSDDEARQATYGRNSSLVLSRPAGAKTGTTENFNDGWTIGFTTQLVTGVWVGNADNSPMTDVFGSSGAGVIWHNYMERAHDYLHLPKEEFPRPSHLMDYRVTATDPVNSRYQVLTEMFVPGTEPPGAHAASAPAPAGACIPGWIVKVNGSPARSREIDKLYRQDIFNSCTALPSPTPGANPNLAETPISQSTPADPPPPPAGQPGQLPEVQGARPPASPPPGQSAPAGQPAPPEATPTTAAAAPPVQPTPVPVQPTPIPAPPAAPTPAPPVATLAPLPTAPERAVPTLPPAPRR